MHKLHLKFPFLLYKRIPTYTKQNNKHNKKIKRENRLKLNYYNEFYTTGYNPYYLFCTKTLIISIKIIVNVT